MVPKLIDDVQSLSLEHRLALRKGNYIDVVDFLLSHPQAVAKKTRLPLAIVEKIAGVVRKECASAPVSLAELGVIDEKFTTGDTVLDELIGGGIRPGMLWEIVGESSSGKTQLALQLSLTIQIPKDLGGLDGCACYLTTHSKLSTNRLVQLSEKHPHLSPSACSLDDVHTRSTPTLMILMYTLQEILPTLIEDSKRRARKPLRLLIIDSITPLFQSDKVLGSSKLTDRSKALYELSYVLHCLATKHNLAVVVLNEVTDVMGNDFVRQHNPSEHVLYRDQAEWFSRSSGLFENQRKEANLGLAWANQVNVRIMLVRTSRRRYADEQLPRKRPRLSDGLPQEVEHQGNVDDLQDAIPLRRFTIIFSCVSSVGSVDFIVTPEGIVAFPESSAENVPRKVGSQSAIVASTAPPAQRIVVVAKERMVAESTEGATMGSTEQEERCGIDADLAPDEDEDERYWTFYDDNLDEAELLHLECQSPSISVVAVMNEQNVIVQDQS